MSAVVRWASNNMLLAGLLAVAIAVVGALAFARLPIDAVPDVTNVQVQVVTRAPALSANEVEAQITQPIERTMAGVPGLRDIRSISKLGISVVTLVFRDDVDVYFARALVGERLASVRDRIPPEIGRPELGPITTALGEIYMFELRATPEGSRSPEELRTIVEWQLAPRLRQVKGVIDVVGFGGSVKQYQVTLDPARLAAHDVSIEQVQAALARDNAVSGGGYVERNGEQVVLRGDARFKSLEDIAATVVRADDNTPLRIGQLGDVDTGAMLRQGAMTRDARGEIVGASIFMLKGENSREVVARVKDAVAEIAPRLPAGVEVDPYYDRAEFIDRVLATVAKNLLEGAGFVVLCLLLTLGSVRAGLLVAGAIPFAMLTAFIGLSAFGLGGNVMSLGAVDFGIVVEGAVVMVEHALTHMGSDSDRERRRRAIVGAMGDVARPVVFGVVIVTLVFLPLVTLEDVEGKMFRPVVLSLVFMLLGALFYALVVVPAVGPAMFARMKKAAKEPLLMRLLGRAYAPTVRLALRRPKTIVAAAFVAAAALFAVASTLGAEFLPRIAEGAFAIDARRPPSTSLTQAVALGAETERALREIPEVKTVVNRIGRPEGAVDPSGPEASDVFVILKPPAEWRPGMTREALVEEMAAALERRVPATLHAFSQPIEMRVNDIVAGVKSDVAVKVYGDDLESMSAAADAVRRALQQTPGAADVKMEIATGLPSIRVDLARDRAARLGVPPRSVLDAVAMSRAGQSVGAVREGERVFDLVLRLGGEQVSNEADLARLPVATSNGALVPLANVADVTTESTVVQISREQMRRRLVVEANVRGRDLVGFVKDAQARVAELQLPHDVELAWGGQFQNFDRAKTRLSLLVPVSLGVIGLLLVMAFRSIRLMLITVLNLPFAVAGGAAALVARGLPFSIPAGVGLIALCGVSVMNGVVMTTQLLAQPADLPEAERVRRAADGSLRPIASTAVVAAIGFVPMALATGAGAEVQRPLATVVIAGLVASMLFSLPALPAMLLLATRRRRPQALATAVQSASVKSLVEAEPPRSAVLTSPRP